MKKDQSEQTRVEALFVAVTALQVVARERDSLHQRPLQDPVSATEVARWAVVDWATISTVRMESAGKSVVILMLTGFTACTLLVDTSALSSLSSDGGSESGAADRADITAPDVIDASSFDVIPGDGATGDAPVSDDQLLAQYAFNETSGLIAHDRIAPPLDLSLPATGVVWASGLHVTSASRVSTLAGADKISARIAQTSALTVEAWVEPANITQSGPARIVTHAPGPDSSQITFTLAQQGDMFVFRTRSVNDGIAGGTATTGRHHVVGVDGSGARELFVDGVRVELSLSAGPITVAPLGTPLCVANEPTDDRPWLGKVLGISIYARAMMPAEIQQRFSRGPPF